MKRKNYDVYLNGEYVFTKHAFNSSTRAIPNYLKELGGSYTLEDATIEKDSSKTAVYGTRLWVRSDGSEFLFETKLRA